jgi:hypothetical protein
MSFRVMFATVVMGVLLVVGAGPAAAKKQPRVHKHHRIVALTATGRTPHLWRLDKALAPASAPRSFVVPFPSGFKCGVYVGYATNNNPREETTFDSVQQGFKFRAGHGRVGGLLMTTCQGTIPVGHVVHPGVFRSHCFQLNQFPTGPTTIQGVGATRVFRDGQYHGICITIRVPFS